MEWIGGIFSADVFHPGVFDTGYQEEDEQYGPPERARRAAKAFREDEEMLEFVLTAVTSGLLEN